MESQRPTQPGPDPGMCGCDRDIFLRVWQRVMPQERPDCPISVEEGERAMQTLSPAAAPRAGKAAPAPAPACRNTSTPEPAPAARNNGALTPMPPATDAAGDDFPTPDDVPCLGSAAMADLERLQELMGQELVQWRAYQILARRVSGPGGRTLSALAGGSRRRAKRLSAALFLISGVRHWAEPATVPAPRSYFGALREHFQAEQNRMCAYRAAAEDCRDMCLRALYLDLAEEGAQRAGSIRTLLENA